MSNYSELLKDPRWQRKRLEILQRDNWQCQACLSTTKTLHVHHLQYKGKPWEADSKHLITLCDVCHSDEEQYLEMVPAVLKAFNDRGVLSCMISDLLIVAMMYVDNAKDSKILKPEVIEGDFCGRARMRELITLIKMEIENKR